MAFKWIPLDTGYFQTNNYVTTYEPKENDMNEKFFIYAITDSSIKKYYLSGQQLLSFYQVARVIRIATNQECVFLDNGTKFSWVDLDEQQITF